MLLSQLSQVGQYMNWRSRHGGLVSRVGPDMDFWPDTVAIITLAIITLAIITLVISTLAMLHLP